MEADVKSSMKFITKVQPLAQALAAAAKVINQHSTVPVLQNILLTTVDGAIIVRATDLETTFERIVPAAVIAGGRTTVPGKLFAAYIGELPAEEVSVFVAGENIFVECAHSRADFVTLDAANYPQPASGTTAHVRDLRGELFAEAIDATVFAMNESGAGIRGGCLTIDEKAFQIMGTDGYRLARYAYGNPDLGRAVVVPARGLAAIGNSFAKSARVTLSIVGGQENHLLADDGETKVWTRLIDLQYPDTDKLFAIATPITVTANREDLLLALKRAVLMTDDKAHSLVLSVKDDLLSIYVESTTLGVGRDSILVDKTGDDIRLNINAQYFIEIVNHIKSLRVTIGFSGELTPIVLGPADDQTPSCYLLMPLKL